MLTEVERRAASLAVLQFRVDPVDVERVVRWVEDSRARGERVDFFELLSQENLLDRVQIHDLRFGLESTQIDPINGTTVHGDVHLRELKRLGGYRILRLLGEGGMGAVFLAYSERERCQVALKVMSADLARQSSNLDRFFREAKSGAALNHPNIVRNLTSGKDLETGLHYIVMEYVDGENAQDLLDRFGRLRVGDAIHLILDIARALEYAHSRSIIHRDIKPSNILVAPSGLAKLTDLGLSKRMDETSHLTQTKQGFGTPYYMPYEQAINAKSADGRSDIYALGATLYHLVTGDVPFSADTPMEIVDKKAIGFFLPASSRVADIPEEVDRILTRMMARDPGDRYQTASEVIIDLERSQLGSSVPSFVSADKAMADPHVRQRLTSPAQATQADLSKPPERPLSEDLWYVRFRDGEGRLAKTRLSRREVVARWRQGGWSADAGVSGSPGGPFLPLAEVFEELPADVRARRRSTPRTPAEQERRSMAWMVSICAVAATVVIVSAWLSWHLLRG